MPRPPRPYLLIALVGGLAVTIVLTITGGSLVLLGEYGPRTKTAAERPITPPASPAPAPDESRLAAPPAAPSPPPASPTPPASSPPAPVTGPGVNPAPPRVFAVARASVPQGTLHRISALKHVQKVSAVDGGAVKVAGTGLNLLAVDPAQFRSWTPKTVADQPAVWQALARGELVAELAASRRLGLVLGAEYQVDNGPRLRVAAAAPLHLPGVDGLVGIETGRRLGLLPGVAVLVNGPEKYADSLNTGVRRLLGTGSQVVTVGDDGRPMAVPQKKDDARPRAEQPAVPKRVTVGRPGSYMELYQRSAQVCPGLSWTVLAAIGQVESSHGRNNGPSSAGALGPMQFMPATWKAYGVDGDGDGDADIWSPYDAVPSAANYLCANKAGEGGERLRKAVWFYNHSWDYVNKVLSIADAYARDYS